MRQADIFMEGEGDAWLERNRDKLGQHDPVTEAIHTHFWPPRRVLEIGCSNGWRLAKLREKCGCEIVGVDPSLQAGLEAAERRVPVIQSTASCLPVSGQFDLVIFAFCLYLTDPHNWLQIAAESDRVLETGGKLLIHDFARSGTYARAYEHRSGVLSYHVDFSRLWLANPVYQLLGTINCGKDEEIVMLKKRSIGCIQVLP